jgi:hypothetical protein
VSEPAHIRRMLEQQPTFMARKNPGTGWRVDILWPDGETEVVKGFITEHDAARWIAEHSQADAPVTRYRQGSS